MITTADRLLRTVETIYEAAPDPLQWPRVLAEVADCFGDVENIKLGAYAVTEPQAGSDVKSLKTTAKREGDEWVLNGTKVFITNGGIADVHVVVATVDPALGHRGQASFIVPGDAPGMTMGKKEDPSIGIPVKKVHFMVFLISGLTVAVAGLALTARVESGQPNAAGLLNLEAVAAIVVGGTSLYGGRGSVVRTLWGVLLLTLINNGLDLNRMDADLKEVTLGVVLVIAASADFLRRKLRGRRAEMAIVADVEGRGGGFMGIFKRRSAPGGAKSS